jgi:hypothetical protein
MERQVFEDSWKESFKDSEISPSDSLWTNIELDLEKADGKAMKKRVLYFKLLAAASVAFAMTFAGVGGYYLLTQKQDTHLAEQQNKASEQARNSSITQGSNEISGSSPKKSEVVISDQTLLDSQALTSDSKKNNTGSKSSTKSRTLHGNQNVSSQESFTVASDIDRNKASGKLKNETVSTSGFNSATNNESTRSTNSSSATQVAATPENDQRNTADDLLLPLAGSLPVIAHINKPSMPAEHTQSTADPISLMLAKQNERERELSSEKSKEKEKHSKNDRERIWTSVGFAAGSFNTVNPGSTASTQNGFASLNNSYASNNVVQSESSAPGKSYSAGVSVGGKVSERWVLQGGVNYQTQSSSYTTSAVVRLADPEHATYKAASIAEISNAGKTDSRLVNTSTYSVNSNLQYISVPVQAGYMVVNRAVGLQFNAGVSTDLFLQSTLTPDGGTLEKSTQGNGDDSPYRPVNFSGLVGTELSYRFGYRYRLSINPGLRYPFSSIYKSDVPVSANPLTFDVGLRFRYIFN